MTSADQILAYRSIPDLKARQERVYGYIARYERMSRNDISRASGMEPRNVSNRIRELIVEGRVIVVGTKTDRLTGKVVRVYAPAGGR